MKTPESPKRAAENALSPAPARAPLNRSVKKGEVPASVLDSYLIERDRQGRPERYYRDHRAADPMFRDEGRRLVAGQAYPDTIADMMKIARHRGWTEVRVAGDEAFRREACIQARAEGLQVKGYKPRDRDRQAAGEAERSAPTHLATGAAIDGARQRVKAAAVIVRRLVADPAAQARLIERAYTRIKTLMPQTSRDQDRASSGKTDKQRLSR